MTPSIRTLNERRRRANIAHLDAGGQFTLHTGEAAEVLATDAAKRSAVVYAPRTLGPTPLTMPIANLNQVPLS